jgi:hypothetical protein
LFASQGLYDFPKALFDRSEFPRFWYVTALSDRLVKTARIILDQSPSSRFDWEASSLAIVGKYDKNAAMIIISL